LILWQNDAESSCSCDEYKSQIGLDTPIAIRIGLCQCVARDDCSEADVIKLLAHRPQAGLDVAQTFAICQLFKSHAEKLISARELPHTVIAAVATDTAVKLVGQQKVHQLREDGLSYIHCRLLPA
jgi:hypothetical protein